MYLCMWMIALQIGKFLICQPIKVSSIPVYSRCEPGQYSIDRCESCLLSQVDVQLRPGRTCPRHQGSLVATEATESKVVLGCRRRHHNSNVRKRMNKGR
jgi:hypothetical protein